MAGFITSINTVQDYQNKMIGATRTTQNKAQSFIEHETLRFQDAFTLAECLLLINMQLHII